MIITQQQSKNLRQYLSEVFSYRETITEIYDHIISALEQYEGDLPFQDAVNNIIKVDFGGQDNLVDLEKRFKSAASHEIRSQIWSAFSKNIKSWGVLLGLTLLIISFNHRALFMNKQFIFGILMAVGFGAFLLNGLRTFRSGYLYGMEKNSIKDRILTEVTAIPMRLVLVIILLNTATGSNILKDLSPNVQYVGTIVLYTTVSTFLLSYYQCFNKEYSLKVTDN